MHAIVVRGNLFEVGCELEGMDAYSDGMPWWNCAHYSSRYPSLSMVHPTEYLRLELPDCL